MEDKNIADFPIKSTVPNSNGNGISNTIKSHRKCKLSQSAPNTSFIENQTTGNAMMMDNEEDINSNPANDALKEGDPKGLEFQSEDKCPRIGGTPTPPEVIKRTGNSLEVSIDVIEDNSGKCLNRSREAEDVPIVIGVDPDRSNRIDVLWRVAEGMPPDTDASVSNCVMFPEQQTPNVKFQQNRSRIIPQFQQKRPQKTWGADELGQGSQTRISDPNENAVLLSKKSEDEQGDRPRGAGEMYNIQPIEPQRKLRREPLTWPWHSGSYQMNFRFHTPEFRALFSSKIIIMKALQWLVATIWTHVAYSSIPYFRDNQNDLTWTLYLAGFFLLLTFLTVRSTNFVDNQTSTVVLLIYTLCIAHISAMLHIHYECSIIPIVLITMTTTYILSALTFTCIPIDADSPIVFYPIFLYVIMTSIVAFWFVLALGNATIQNPLGKMITIWFPCCLMALIVSSLEMLEIQALLRGRRTPLEPTDWVLATTYLL